MSIKTWTGNALAVAQQETYAPGPQPANTTLTATINGKSASYQSAAGSNDDLIGGLIGAINKIVQQAPEFAEVQFQAANYVPAVPAPNATYLNMTAKVPGTPFEITFTLVTPPTISVVQTTAGEAGVNERQQITISPNAQNGYDNALSAYSHSSFTLTFGAQTTPAIPTPPSAPATATSGAGVLTGSYQYLVTFTTAYGETEPSPLNYAAGSILEPVVCAANQVALSFIPTGPSTVTGRNIYRCTANNTNGPFYLLHSIADNSTTSYTDNATDASLITTATPPTTNTAAEGAFQSLSSVGNGNAKFSGAGVAAKSSGWPLGSPIVYEIEFTGTLGSASQSLVSGSVASVTILPRAVATETQAGFPPQNEIQEFGWEQLLGQSAPSGTFTATLPGLGVTTAPILWNASAATVQAALVAAAGPSYATSFSVSSVQSTNAGYLWSVQYDGPLALQPVPLVTINTGKMLPASGDTVSGYQTRTQHGSVTGQNEIVTVTLPDAATAGTFMLAGVFSASGTYLHQVSSGVAYNVSVASLQANINTTLGNGCALVSGTAGGPYLIEFTGEYGNQKLILEALSTLSGSTAATFTAIELVAGAAAVNAVQTITLSGATGGTFLLDFENAETAAIAYDATNATVQSDLQALSTVGNGGFTVAGAAGGPYTVTAAAGLAGSPLPLIAYNGAGLTGSVTTTPSPTTVTASTGPNNWDNAANWSPAGVPATGDTVVVQNTKQDILYGLAQSAVVLAGLQIDLSFVGGWIGLPAWNGKYYEYRQQYLQIGCSGTILIGNGKGSGPTLIKLDTGTNATKFLVNGTGTSTDPTLPVIQWKGARSAGSTELNIYKGTFGAALFAGETATIDTIRQGYVSNVNSDSFVTMGPGVTINTSWSMTGGQGSCYCSCPLLSIEDGTLTAYDGLAATTLTTLTLIGGYLSDRTTGATATLTVGSGSTYDRSDDNRPKTITNTSIYAATTFLDPNKTITFTNPYQLVNCGYPDLTKFDVGTNINGQRT